MSDLYIEATRLQTKLARQTGHVRDNKPHTKTRAELIAACEGTLEALRAVSRIISPRNPIGYTDPRQNGELHSEDCLAGWRNEIDLLIKYVDGKTPF